MREEGEERKGGRGEKARREMEEEFSPLTCMNMAC